MMRSGAYDYRQQPVFLILLPTLMKHFSCWTFIALQLFFLMINGNLPLVQNGWIRQNGKTTFYLCVSSRRRRCAGSGAFIDCKSLRIYLGPLNCPYKDSTQIKETNGPIQPLLWKKLGVYSLARWLHGRLQSSAVCSNTSYRDN